MNRTDLTEIAALLRRARRILAVCHIVPDGDAVGSLLGLGWLLRRLPVQEPGLDSVRGAGDPAGSPHIGHGDFATASAGHQVTLACADEIPAQLAFLPGISEIALIPLAGPRDCPSKGWDAVVTLDASDTERLGKAFPPGGYGAAPIINLDHHVTNLRFGNLNYVDTTAVATAQVVVSLADALGAPLTPEAAVCLLTGLVTDTIGFRTSNVTPQALATAIRLMNAGANLADITERTLNHKPLSMMRLWGSALDGLQIAHRVVWTKITQEMRSQAGAPESGESGLSSFLISAPEADIVAVFSERPDGRIEVSFRARPGYDVSSLALSLGGGGHPPASGCIVPGPLAAAEARVFPLLFALGQGDGTAL
jgi:phosphoesterase RecJ-like protein